MILQASSSSHAMSSSSSYISGGSSHCSTASSRSSISSSLAASSSCSHLSLSSFPFPSSSSSSPHHAALAMRGQYCSWPWCCVPNKSNMCIVQKTAGCQQMCTAAAIPICCCAPEGRYNTPMQESCLQRVLSVHVKACIILYTSAGAGRASSGVSCWVGSHYSSSAIDTLPCKSCGTHVSCCMSGMSHMYFCCCRHYNHAGQDWCTLTCHASVLRASSVCAHAQCANSLILLPQFSEW